MGETPTSVTAVTYLDVVSDVRLQYECLYKMQIWDLSGMTEIFGYPIKIASYYN